MYWNVPLSWAFGCTTDTFMPVADGPYLVVRLKSV